MKKSFFFNLICFFSLFFSFSVYSENFNPYEVLGLEETATLEEIKTAYRAKSREWHPDVSNHPQATEKFQEIQRAYDILQELKLREKERSRTYGSRTNEHFSRAKGFYRTFRDIFNESKKRTQTEQMELKSYERRAIETFYEFSFFQKKASEFLSTEARYLNILKEQQSGLTLSREQERDLKDYRTENLKDLEVLKRVLYQLGLPYETLHPFLLQTYLDNLKREWYNNSQKTELIRPEDRRFRMERVREALAQIKTSIDTFHYESLKENSRIFKKSFFKGFGSQFIIIHTAIGFSIYMQALYNKLITGYEKNPGEVIEAINQSVTPSGLFSLVLFMAVAAQVEYRLYGLGRFLDGKTVLGMPWNGRMARFLAPGFGMGAGFIFYTVFEDLWREPYLMPCVKEQKFVQWFFKGGEDGSLSSKKDIENLSAEEEIDIESPSAKKKIDPKNLLKRHISPCEQFRLNWQAGEKWTVYGINMVNILGSSFLSHKITSSLARHLNRTMIGHSVGTLLMRKLGPKIIRGGNFLINMVFLTNIYPVFENWAGKPLKKQFLAGGVYENVSNLSDSITNIDFIQPEFLAQNPNKPEGEATDSQNQDRISPIFFNRVIKFIQSLGNRFRIWTEFVNQDYMISYSFWMQDINKRFINYESSLIILDQLFVLSQLDYNIKPEESFLEEHDKDVQYFIDSNNFSYNFQFHILDEDRKHYKKQYCSILEKENFIELILWTNLCEEDGSLFMPDSEDEGDDKNKRMVYETSYLIYDLLQKIEFPDYGLKVENYISLERDEIFSSDPNFSIQNFVTGYNAEDHNKKISLAKQMIQKGLELEALLDGFSESQIYELKRQKAMKYFPDYQLDENQTEFYSYFMNPSRYSDEIKTYCDSIGYEYVEDLEYCYNFFEISGREEIITELSFKFLTAGIYLLQEFFKKDSYINYATIGPVGSSTLFEPVKDLIQLIETSKKGERIFFNYVEARESTKTLLDKADDWITEMNRSTGIEFGDLHRRDGNTYFIFYDLICRSSIEIDSNSFSVPQLLNDFDDIELYDFKTKQYEPLSSFCREALRTERIIHEFLFGRPARYQGDFYENLYLSVEHIVGSSYRSKEDLKKSYHQLSLNQLEVLSEPIFSEMQLLMDQFYKKTINEEVEFYYNAGTDFQGVNQELLDYYGENKVRFNLCSFYTDLSFGLGKNLVGDCGGEFKNIEVSIFQVNYLLRNLKTLLIKGEEIKIYDEERNCETLNECLLDIEGLNEELFNIMHSRVITRLQSIQDCYRDDEKDCLPENLTDRLMIFILSYSVPKLLRDNSFMDDNLENTKSHWGKLIYSIVFELRKSLDNFSNQLQPLTLKRKFEKIVEDPNSL